MPRTAKLPAYRRHKASGQAVVSFGGKDFYLGTHGSKASKHEYDRRIAEFLANGRRLPTPVQENGLTVTEVMAQYLTWAKTYYGASQEFTDIGYAMRPLKALYGRTPAGEFGPLALKAVRQTWIDGGLSRKVVNQRTGRVRRMFKWATENELVPPSVFHGLQAVAGLKAGRSEAKECEPVRPVPSAFVDAVRSHVAPQVWAMIELQRCTGARPGEITAMRTCDLDTSGNVWVYTPATHKTQHHGHQRQIFIGPLGQDILRPWFRLNLQEFLFQPREAVSWQLAQRQAARTTPLSCGNKPGSNRVRKPKRLPREKYTTHAYMNAVRRACKAAGVQHWHPHQLRHNAATMLRKKYGLDVARCVLGHKSAAITEVYAEADFSKARQVIEAVG